MIIGKPDWKSADDKGDFDGLCGVTDCSRRDSDDIVAIDLDRFHDLVFDLRFERPAPGSELDGRYESADTIPIALDAPFGEGGPMLFRFGDMLSLLFDWSTVQSGMKVSDPQHLLFDYTRLMMGFRLFRPRPLRIEMIGLGGGSLAKACYRALPIATSPWSRSILRS